MAILPHYWAGDQGEWTDSYKKCIVCIRKKETSVECRLHNVSVGFMMFICRNINAVSMWDVMTGMGDCIEIEITFLCWSYITVMWVGESDFKWSCYSCYFCSCTPISSSSHLETTRACNVWGEKKRLHYNSGLNVFHKVTPCKLNHRKSPSQCTTINFSTQPFVYMHGIASSTDLYWLLAIACCLLLLFN